MKKTLSFLFLLSGILIACAAQTPEEQVDTAIEEVQDMNTDFYNQYKDGTPEEVLDARYTELVKQYGEPDTYDSGLNADGSHNIGFADVLSTELNLDYAKLAYVQIQTGTYGIQTLLETMDQEDAAVTELTASVQNYHKLTDYDADYIEELMPSGLSDQEKVEFIVKTFADEYRMYYEPYRTAYISNPETVKKMAELGGLNGEDLALIFAFGYIQDVVNLFPDSWESKADVAELLDY